MRARRISSWVAGAILILLLCVGVALAFTLGNVDGVWGTPDNDGALCDSWATGPSGGSTDYDNPTDKSATNPGIQGTLGGFDWNQVRYGSRDFDNGNCNCDISDFYRQSGFGFDGVNDVDEGDGLVEGDSFLLGKWCHFNNPIYNLACDNTNHLEWVDLDIRVADIACDPAATAGPLPDGTMDFGYRFFLDETPNSGPDCGGTGEPACTCLNGSTDCGPEWWRLSCNEYYCPYPTGEQICPDAPGTINSNGCADRVQIGAALPTDSFTCYYGEGGTEPSTEYKIQILGFVELADPETSCPLSPSGDFSSSYISEEEGDRCACLYAKVTEATGTAVELLRFDPTSTRSAITLNWETASETDNLGFNLYRAEALGGERVKLNAELIPTNVPPGSPFGAAYEYTDKPNGRANAYYYWLEDVEIDGDAELHGPVKVALVRTPGVQDLLRKLVPVKPPVKGGSAEGQTD